MNLVLPERRLILPPKGLLVPRLVVARRRFGPPRRPSTMHQMLLAMGGGAPSPAPVFDAATYNTNNALPTLTFSHTCTGSNRGLIVNVSSAGGVAVSSVTYNGVGLTFIQAQNDGGGPNSRAEQWKLSNPASGANNVVVTMASDALIAVGAISFTGAHQTTASLTGTPAKTSTASSTTISVNVTSATNEVVTDIACEALGAVFTVGGGQTQRWGTAGTLARGSTEAGASTTTMSWSFDFATAAALCAVSVKPP